MQKLLQQKGTDLTICAEVVLNALIYDGLESVSQITQWRIK